MRAGFNVAWLQLRSARGRFFAAAAGIAFTAMFSMLQLGFQAALNTSVTLLYSHLNADLIAIGPRYQCIVATSSFPERRLDQILGFKEVRSVSPLYMGLAAWKNPVNGSHRQIFLIGFTPHPGVFDYASVNHAWEQMAEPGKVMFDEASRPEFGPVPQLFLRRGTVTAELAHRQVEIVGLFRVGANFANDGNILTSDSNFFRLVPNRGPEAVDMGIIQLQPGVDVESVRTRIVAALPPDVVVLTKQGLLRREQAFFDSSLPVGFFFRISVIIGLVVGAVIVYQILYNDVSERFPEYATLKAIGYSDTDLFGIVLEQAVILSVAGFVPGLMLSLAVYQLTRAATLLPIEMTVLRVIAGYLLIFLMCTASGLLAMRELRRADPADVF
jgi:putative ABC transport system permease protein